MGDPKPAVRCFTSGKFRDWIAHELANPLHGMLWSVEAMDIQKIMARTFIRRLDAYVGDLGLVIGATRS